MKRSLFIKNLKRTLLVVPVAALMLGASQGHAQTTVAMNFEAWYYDSKTTPQTIGYGAGYQTTGWPVTATAFGIPAANWYGTASPDLLNANTAVNNTYTFGPGGALSAALVAPGVWQSGIGEQVAGWHPETVAPGNDEVTWNYLTSSGGTSPSVTISGLAAKFPNGYAIQTIAAKGGAVEFNGVGFTDGTTSSHADYSTYMEYGTASDGYDSGNGTVGLSGLSGTFTGDTLQINCDAQTTGSNSVLSAFIISDVPVVTRNVAASVVLFAGDALTLPPPSVVGIGMSYRWQLNGNDMPGATSSGYTKGSVTLADSGTYQAVVTSSYFPSISVTGLVANVIVVPQHPPQASTFDADTTTPGAQDGSGTWGYGHTNWWNGTLDDFWNPTDSAIFGADVTGNYTVALDGNITADSITFNSGSYTITNTSGQTITLQGDATIIANVDATVAAPLSIPTNTFVKAGAGYLTLSGKLTSTNAIVRGGTLEVRSRASDLPYVVTNGATLKIGYSTGGGYANTGLKLYGDGTAATTGLYLKGGTSYNVSGGVVINGAPTTIREYGSGVASFNIFDINSNPGLSTTAAASGSVVDSNIQMVRGGYGMVITTAVGANTATGDLILNGALNINNTSFTGGLNKKGAGSLRLNATATGTNSGVRIVAGSVICGAANCVGTNALLDVRAGATFDLNGTSQTVSNALLNGTVKMSINKGGSPSSTVLTVIGGNSLNYGGNLVVTNLGGALALGDTFTLFTNTLGNYNYGGAFANITLPALTDGLAWQTANLNVDGTIQVITGSVPPSITFDLAGTTNYAYVGGDATMTIGATGDPTLRYEWRKNGTIPVGTDSPTLILSGVGLGDAGYYSCTVTNDFGTVPSQTNYLQVATPSAAVATAIQDAPASFWPLNETEPSTAYDYWSGNNGVQNGGLTLGVPGPVPPADAGFDAGTTAYQFDGASAYISLGTGPSLSGNTDFTLEAWINTTNTASSMILQQRSSGNGYIGEYLFQVNGNGTLNFTIYGSGGYQFSFSSSAAARRVNDGQWHHVAAVRSGVNGYLYVDGGLVGSASGAIQALDPTIPSAIGLDLRNGNLYFNGSMCDVAIYTTALTASRIGAHAAAGVLGGAPLALNLVPGGWVEDSKPAGTPHDGKNLGTTWLASSTDLASATRTGVAQFSSGAQVAIPPDTDFNSPTGTICFWMQTAQPAAGHGMMLVDRRTTSGMVIVLDGTPSGGLDIQYTGNASFSTGGYVIDSVWHHVAITYDQSASGSVSVYVDGSQVGSQANTAAWSWPTNQQIELGRSHDTYWQEFNGQMDDFRIYNRALTTTEIQTIATPATSDTLVDTNALVVRYNFDTAAGVGTGLAWPQIGVLQSSPVLGPSAVWTPINTTTAAYPFLPPAPAATTNSALFYRIQQ